MKSLEPERLNAFQVFLHIQKSKEAGKPFSLIRLGDGEASILGYPQFTTRESVTDSMWAWFDKPTWKWQIMSVFKALRNIARQYPPPSWRRQQLYRSVRHLVCPNRRKLIPVDPPRIRVGFTPRSIWKPIATWDEKDVLTLSEALRRSVTNADIVGLLDDDITKAPAHLRARIEKSLTGFNLLTESTLLTHISINTHLNHALLYRPMLEKLDFVGIISSRDMEEKMKKTFGIREVRQYKVRSEPSFPNGVSIPHYPDRFNEIYRTLKVPYPGALFLVGAGIFGKIYCEWIKQRGGRAIDVGSLFDSWANFGRVYNQVNQLDAYSMYKKISRLEAIGRYNAIIDYKGTSGPKADPNDDCFHALPDHW